jgi:arylsulfatase A-like enzyme
MVVRLPGIIPAGTVCSELATTMDLLPTLAGFAKGKLPTHEIDGRDISSLLRGESEARSPHEVLYYYRRRQLQAIRWGNWKWHLPLASTFPRWNDATFKSKGRAGKLIDLETDLKEQVDVSSSHPQVMEKMRAFAKAATKDLGNEAEVGSGQRKSLTLDHSVPMILPR